MMTQTLESLSLTDDEILQQLDLMLSSPDFKATPQQAALFKYVVNQTLDGKADTIKGYTIATEVFGRRSDFDQNIDPIVSIQAARLRRALARYYQTTGKEDRIHIDIPKGSYVPVFDVCESVPARQAEIHSMDVDNLTTRFWPSVFVRPVSNFMADPEFADWETGMAADLADELSRYPDIRVITLDPDDPQTTTSNYCARFVIDGSIRGDQSCIKVVLKLTDTRTNRQIWSESYRSEVETGRTIAFQEKIARGVAVKVAGRRGWVAKVLDREYQQGHSPKNAQAYEAIASYNDYRATATPEAFQRALKALEEAATCDPDCGQVWTTRARFFAEIYALDIQGIKRPLEQALAFALNGQRLSPDDQRSHIVMAFIHLLRGDIAMGLAEAERALQLGPETLFTLDSIGHVLTLLGDWERGPALIEKAIRLNSFYNNYAHYALWVNCLRQKDYDRAWQETVKLNRPKNFWDPLAKAATLGLLGRIEEGREAAADLLALRPDFAERGHLLIARFVKFDDIREQIVDGLGLVGVNLESLPA